MLSQKPIFTPARRISEATKGRNAGKGVASILNPVNGYRDALARKGVKPKNHHKENLQAIRKKEELNHTAKAEADAEAQKSKFKMSRFANVPAKVTQYMPPPGAAAGAAVGAAAGAPPNGTVGGGAYLKRGTRADAHAAAAATKAAAAAPGRAERRKSVSKPAVPSVAELKATAAAAAAAAPAQPPVNYVTANSRDVLQQSAALASAKASAAAAPSTAYVDKAEFGRVPDYLVQRKLEQAAEADRRRMASKANDGVPPGMVKLSDEERAQTLQLLNTKQSDLLVELSRVPMFVETPSTVKRKFAIEQSLKQVEDAIKVFSRKIVYVKAS